LRGTSRGIASDRGRARGTLAASTVTAAGEIGATPGPGGVMAP